MDYKFIRKIARIFGAGGPVRRSGLIRFAGKRFERRRSLTFVGLLCLLGGLCGNIVASGPLVAVDQRLAELLYFYRDEALVRFFLGLTWLGALKMVISGGLIFTLWLWLQNKLEFIPPLWVTITGSGLCGAFGKIAFQRPRPIFGVITEATFSFPSGHATMAVAFYGFLVYCLGRKTKSRLIRLNWLLIGGLVISGIGLSRLYLGVHFLSDVLGGYCLGSLWLIIGIGLVESRLFHRDPPTVRLHP